VLQPKDAKPDAVSVLIRISTGPAVPSAETVKKRPAHVMGMR
jgi:hypothetical protein